MADGLLSYERHALRQTGLLAGLVDEPCFAPILDDPACRHPYGPGELILAKDSPSQGLFLVIHGSVEMVLSNRQGEERLVRISRAGDSFGLESLFCGRPAIYALRALTQCVLLYLPRDVVFDAIDACPSFASRLVRLVAAEVEGLYGELDGIQSRNAVQRLVCYFHCGETKGCPGIRPAVQELILTLPYFKLAQRLGTSQPHLSRALRSLETDGVIQRKGRRIRFADPLLVARIMGHHCQAPELVCS